MPTSTQPPQSDHKIPNFQTKKPKGKPTFWESQRLAKMRAIEKQARKRRVKLADLAVFTQQLSSMLMAGLPLVGALEALQDQTENLHFKVIIREVRNSIASGSSFSDAVRKFPNAFPHLFISMVEAGEASGALGEIMGKIAVYFEDSLKLSKKIKSAMTYPAAVIMLAFILVNVLLIFVIPVFADMFSGFGAELPKPTQMLIDISDFMQSNVVYVLTFLGLGIFLLNKFFKTVKGRIVKDKIILRVPIFGQLSQKVSLSRFCRTYAILLKSGVPILRSLDICGAASDNTFIEHAVKEIIKTISQGGQFSDSLNELPYFPSMVRYMARAGEQTGNVDGMMNKVSDFYDTEIENIVNALTSLMEPILIVVLGVVIGGIVMAMFLPIFQLSSVVGGIN